MKMSQKHNKDKGNTITCSYIWHIDLSKCVYWLDIQVLWRYVLPNAYATPFCVHIGYYKSINKK